MRSISIVLLFLMSGSLLRINAQETEEPYMVRLIELNECLFLENEYKLSESEQDYLDSILISVKTDNLEFIEIAKLIKDSERSIKRDTVQFTYLNNYLRCRIPFRDFEIINQLKEKRIESFATGCSNSFLMRCYYLSDSKNPRIDLDYNPHHYDIGKTYRDSSSLKFPPLIIVVESEEINPVSFPEIYYSAMFFRDYPKSSSVFTVHSATREEALATKEIIINFYYRVYGTTVGLVEFNLIVDPKMEVGKSKTYLKLSLLND